MKNVMFNIVAESVENFEDAENICGFLEEDEKEMKNPIFVLFNTSGMNGAVCMRYDGVIEQFFREQGADVIILPSSIHKLLILRRSEEKDYEDLGQMVQNVNGSMLQRAE